jgi:hypothetical protein
MRSGISVKPKCIIVWAVTVIVVLFLAQMGYCTEGQNRYR